MIYAPSFEHNLLTPLDCPEALMAGPVWPSRWMPSIAS